MSWLIGILIMAAPAERPAVDVRQASEILGRGEKERVTLVAYCRAQSGRDRQNRPRYRALASALEKQRGYFFPTASLSVGSVGVLRNELRGGQRIGDFLDSPDLRVFQVIDSRNVLAKFPGGKIVWLRGFRADAVEDGRIIGISRPVSVSETTQYRNALGTSNTVLVIEPFKVDEEVFRRAAEQLKLIRPDKKESPLSPAAGTAPASGKPFPSR